MVSCFISYSRVDREFATELAEKLKKVGHDVWLDSNLQGGQQYRAEIYDKIDQVDKVIVLWTKTSIESRWVLDEATLALEFGKLVPVGVVRPPLGFGQEHTIALRRDLPESNIDAIDTSLGSGISADVQPGVMKLSSAGVESERSALTSAITSDASYLALAVGLYIIGFVRTVQTPQQLLIAAPSFTVFALAFGSACGTLPYPKSNTRIFLIGLLIPIASISSIIFGSLYMKSASAGDFGGLTDKIDVIVTVGAHVVFGLILGIVALFGKKCGLYISRHFIEKARQMNMAERITGTASMRREAEVTMLSVMLASWCTMAASSIAASAVDWMGGL